MSPRSKLRSGDIGLDGMKGSYQSFPGRSSCFIKLRRNQGVKVPWTRLILEIRVVRYRVETYEMSTSPRAPDINTASRILIYGSSIQNSVSRCPSRFGAGGPGTFLHRDGIYRTDN